MIAGQEKTAFKVFDTMKKPLKTDGTSPPIGRFLIVHLTKVNSVRIKIYLIFYIISKVLQVLQLGNSF